MGYFIVNIGSSGIVDKSLLPVDLQNGTMLGQLLVTGPGNAWAYSPQPSTPPAVAPVFLLAGDPSRLNAAVLIAQLAAGGTGNIQEWRAANGGILARLDNVGKFQSARFILYAVGASGPDMALIPISGGQSVLSVWHGLQINALRQSTPDFSPANVGAVGDYHIIIPLNQATKVGVGIRAKAGQTGDLQQWQDSAGAVLARVSAAGILFGNGSGLTNVPVGAHTHPGSDVSSPVANALNADAVPWTGVMGKPTTFTPSAHSHPGSEITSQVASAQAADSVPWAGVSGKPSTFPPAAHTHAGSDITSPVNSALSASSAPWAGVTGKPATFPPDAHQHAGSDILSGSIPGDRLQDGAVTYAKLWLDINGFTDLSTTPQALNGGIGFSPGLYAFRLSIPNGTTAVFLLSVALRNGSYEYSVNNMMGGSVSVSGVFGVTYFDFTNMFDGRTYRISFNTSLSTATINVASGVATGQTTLSFRRIV